MEKVELAIFGTGYWGTKLAREYAAIETSTGDVKLVYVIDSSSAALDSIKNELNKPVYPFISPEFRTNYFDALNDPKVEAVHIALPNHVHYKVARDALEAGKHVLLEKPIATNSREAFKIARLAEEKGLVLQVGHIFRFNNAIRTTRELLRSGKIGKIFYAGLNWTTRMNPLPVGRDIVFDLAPHPLDILNFLLDEWPVGVDAVGDSFVQKKADSEEVAFIHLEFPDQIIASIYLSWIHHGAKERSVKIIGEKGTVTCDALNQKIQFDFDDSSIQIPISDVGGFRGYNDNSQIDLTQSSESKNVPNNTIRDMQLHFVDRIRGRGPQLNSALVGAQTVSVLESITYAMRLGKKIRDREQDNTIAMRTFRSY